MMIQLSSILGMDKDELHLTLSQIIPHDLTFLMFKESVEDFANFLNYWRQELVSHRENG